MNIKKLVICSSVLSSAVLLAACGGGGGNNDDYIAPAPAAGGAIGGVAAKGFLKSAKVTAYCGNSEATADLLVSGVTDSAGAYSLKWTTACTKPLKLVVEKGTGTTMEDEATGNKNVAVPDGFKLRALVADPSATTTKHITPFTDMAAAIAGTSTALTKTGVSNAETAIVTTVLGGDLGAYQAKPLAPTATAMASASADEKRLATMLTVVSAFAQDDATCKAKATDGDKIKCATDAFSTQAKATVTGVSDTGYTVATTVPANTPASMLTATLTNLKAGTITGVTATDLSTDIRNDTSGSAALLTSGTAAVVNAAATTGGTVVVASASGIQAARNLFNSLKTDLLALSNGSGTGYLDQKLSAAQTDWSTNGQASATGFTDYMTAINRAIQMASDAKTQDWNVILPASTASQANSAYATNSSVIVLTDSTGAPQSYVRSFFGFNINNQADNMNCRVLVSEKTLGKATCSYSTGQANSSITAGTPYGTFTGYFHSVEVAESATTSGSYTWQDYLASRSFTTQSYAMPLGFVHIAGNGIYVPAAAAVAGTKLSGTATVTKDTSENLTGFALKGDIQPLGTGQDKSTLDISAALTSTSTTQTANISGSLTNVKGTATTLTMAIASGSQIVGALATSTTNDHATSVNFVTQIKTTGFQYDGTLTMDTFTAKLGSGNYQPANASFTGKISTLTNGTATEFMSGTLTMAQTNLAAFNPTQPVSASNFLKQTMAFSGKVTNGTSTYAVTFTVDGSSYTQEVATLNYTSNGNQMISVTDTKIVSTGVHTLAIKGSGDVNATLTNGSGDVNTGTTRVGSITKSPNQVNFSDGTYLLLGS